MNRPNGVFKKRNDYDALFPSFDRIPKSVFAAVAASLILRNNNEAFADVEDDLLNEWNVLFNNKIVPQKPFKKHYEKKGGE